jgi:STE24 endopeptidase
VRNGVLSAFTAPHPRPAAVPALAATLLAAELAVALLRPRERAIDPAPVQLRAYFSEPEIAAGRAYARPQRRLGLVRAAVETALVAGLALQSPRPLRRRRLAGRLPARRAPRAASARDGARAGAALTLASTVVTLPLAAAGRRRALRAGLATQSWGGWAADVLRANAIGATFAAAGGALATELRTRLPERWWLAAAGGGVALSAGAAFAAPVLLEPLFNRFTPLPEGPVREDVLALARDAGVDVGEVFEVDASRRTTAANAYVTGLGATKRVVLFDTLLRDYERDELRLVVAHELAHVRHRDVVRGLAQLAIVAPFAARAVERLAARMGVTASTPPAVALPRLMLALGLAGLPLGLASARLSRAIERRADAFALRLTDAPAAMIAFQRRIALQNRADLEPPRRLMRVLASHPPTIERIGAAVAFAQGG